MALLERPHPGKRPLRGPKCGGWLWSAIRKLVFRFDAESVHHFTVRCLRILHALGERTGTHPLRLISSVEPLPTPQFQPRQWTLAFPNRIGLAAGFDKNAELLATLPDLGFGFAEIGTVTPRPQDGNPRPRLFRDPARQAIFNRMGFNGEGAAMVSQRLRQVRPQMPAAFRVGVNVGKNKDTALDHAAADYAQALQPFAGLVDYAVINVSSPNTPGLRSLQALEALGPILEASYSTLKQWTCPVPLFLKLAPELTPAALKETVAFAEGRGVGGFVLTNTWAGTFESARTGSIAGGWSGALLTEPALVALRTVRACTQLPIISVGGIMNVAQAQARIDAGADLLQIYSGWIYGGPRFPGHLAANIHES